MANAASHPCSDTICSEQLLSKLAMQFRGTSDTRKRTQIAKEYRQVVKKLSEGGKWKDVPPPEDQLPDEFMPPEFNKHWASQSR